MKFIKVKREGWGEGWGGLDSGARREGFGGGMETRLWGEEGKVWGGVRVK